MRSIEKSEEDVKLFQEFLSGKTGVQLSKEKGITGNRVSIILSRVRHMLTRPEVVDLLEPSQKPNPDTMVEMCECSIQHAREHKREWALLIAAWQRMTSPANVNSPVRSTKDHLATLGMSVRTMNALAAVGIKTIGDLMQCTEEDLVSIHQLSVQSVREINVTMGELGIALRTPQWIDEMAKMFNPPTTISVDLKDLNIKSDVLLGSAVRTLREKRVSEGTADVDEAKIDEHFAKLLSAEKNDFRVQNAKLHFGRSLNACLMGRGIDLWTFETFMALIGKSKITITVE